MPEEKKKESGGEKPEKTQLPKEASGGQTEKPPRKRAPRKRSRAKKPAGKTAQPASQYKATPEEMADESPIPETGFEGLDVSVQVLRALARMGFHEATAIQKQTIPLMMQGHDIIGIAPTGTGKTCAFGIPMLEYMYPDEPEVQELVLAPTRELAMQIGDELRKLAYYIPEVRIAVLYGGQSIHRQLEELRQQPQIIVGTPGRVLDHLERRSLSLSRVHTLVLDEADEMLDMGFIRDVCRIIDRVPQSRQFVMYSATTSQDVMTISWKYQHDPAQITVQAVNENRPQIKQYVIKVQKEEKYERLEYLMDSDVYHRVMIFTNTKFMAHRLCAMLQKNGFDADELHGDIAQNKRSEIMAKFKRGRLAILVCTDVAARGIDVDDVEAVINFDLPNENEYYLHRIGRTGRAHKHGVAFTLMTFAESVRMDEILKYMKTAPTPLHFDEMGILRDENGQAFFENI